MKMVERVIKQRTAKKKIGAFNLLNHDFEGFSDGDTLFDVLAIGDCHFLNCRTYTNSLQWTLCPLLRFMVLLERKK